MIGRRWHGWTKPEDATLTLWESMDAVKTLAGEDYERSYVPAEARRVLDHFDETAV